VEEIRVIKKYRNRKFYDTWDSNYVSMDDIASMIRKGYDVKIIDNKTGEDITPIILSQLVVEEGKKGKGYLPVNFLNKIIRDGEDGLAQFFNKFTQTSIQTIKETSEKLLQKGDEELDYYLKELLSGTQKRFEDFQRKMEKTSKELVEKISVPPKQLDKINDLEDKILSLEDKIAGLEKALKKEKEKK